MNEHIGILGAGGQAEEARSFFKGKVVFFAIDDEYRNRNNTDQIDITRPNDAQQLTPIVAAVGAPAVRREMVNKWPGKNFATIIASNTYVDNDCKIGVGTIIAPGATITTDVKIGEHSILNVGASISHNCNLGDYVTVSPGARIAGNVTLGNGVFVGIGATISNNVSVAPGVVIGAGAVVIHDVEIPNSVVVGCPAKSIRVNEGWLYEI